MNGWRGGGGGRNILNIIMERLDSRGTRSFINDRRTVQGGLILKQEGIKNGEGVVEGVAAAAAAEEE